MLRIEGGMMNQLYLAVGTTFFGTFNPHYFTSCPVAMDHRIAGRKELNCQIFFSILMFYFKNFSYLKGECGCGCLRK